MAPGTGRFCEGHEGGWPRHVPRGRANWARVEGGWPRHVPRGRPNWARAPARSARAAKLGGGGHVRRGRSKGRGQHVRRGPSNGAGEAGDGMFVEGSQAGHVGQGQPGPGRSARTLKSAEGHVRRGRLAPSPSGRAVKFDEGGQIGRGAAWPRHVRRGRSNSTRAVKLGEGPRSTRATGPGTFVEGGTHASRGPHRRDTRGRGPHCVTAPCTDERRPGRIHSARAVRTVRAGESDEGRHMGDRNRWAARPGSSDQGRHVGILKQKAVPN